MSRELERGDNGILNLSKAYRLEVGTGWQMDPGILHAPGSLVTYEPQVNSDVFAMFQSLVEGRVVPARLLVKDVPPDKHDDLDFIIGCSTGTPTSTRRSPRTTACSRVRCGRSRNGSRGLPGAVDLLRNRLVFG